MGHNLLLLLGKRNYDTLRPFICLLISSMCCLPDAGGGKNSVTGRDNGTGQVAEQGAGPSLATYQETKNKETTPVAR